MQLSIITAIKKPVEGLDRTKTSVRREFGTCDQVEHLIKEYSAGSDKLAEEETFESEQLRQKHIRSLDNGVFDGMLQGLAHATGEWIVFLNAGDCFREGFASFFWQALESCPADCGYLYFDGVTIDCKDGREFPRKAPQRLRLRDFYDHVPVLHPALVLRRTIMEKYGYDKDMQLAADFDLMVRLVAAGVPAKHVEFVGASMVSGGLSERRRIRARIEATRSLLRHSPTALEKMQVCIRFGRFLLLHFLITGVVHRLPWLRRWLHRLRKPSNITD